MYLRKDGCMLYISSVDPSLDNGPGINEREFIRVLSARYSEHIHFLIPVPTNAFDHDPNLFTFCHNHFRNRPHHFILHIFSLLTHALRLIHSNNFNFLILRSSLLPIAQTIITRLYPVPYAIKTLGNLLTILPEKGGLIARSLQPFNRAMVLDLVVRAAAVDACTQNFVDFYTGALGDRKVNIQHIDNATSVELFRPFPKLEARSRVGLGQFDPVIGYVGGAPWGDGGRQMVEMSPNLIRHYPRCGIVIVGGGEDIQKLMKLSRKLGSEDHCFFPGRVPYEKVPCYINSFDVCVSLEISERLEKIGNSSQKLRQYLACGKPVVSVAEGNSFVQDLELGSLVDPSDLVQIQNALLKWLQLTDEEKHLFSTRARRYAVKNLSIEKAVEERLDFWDRVLDA